MMKQTDIFNDESLQNDIQDLVAIEQAMIRKTYPLPNLDKELELSLIHISEPTRPY